MRTVISQHHERAPVGAMKWIYEVTNVVGDWKAASDRYARIFGLDAAKFSPIESKEFGYTGTLTLFDPPARLDRIEISQITDANLAMGRFHQRRGDSLYMFFVETDDVGALEQRLQARGRVSQPIAATKRGWRNCSSIRRHFSACWSESAAPSTPGLGPAIPTREARRQGARAEASNLIEMKPAVGFKLPRAGVTPAPQY